MAEDDGANFGGGHRANEQKRTKPRARAFHFIGVLAIIVAFGVVDLLLLWPENHAFAIFFIACIAGLVIIYELAVEIQTGWYWALVAATLFFVGAIIAYAFVGPLPQPT